MNQNLDHCELIVDDQHRQLLFKMADSSTVSITFEKLVELDSLVHRIDEEVARQRAQEWKGIKIYRNSPNIPVDIELLCNVLAKVNIGCKVEDSVHPEYIQVQQKDIAVAIGIINRLGYETDKDSEE